MDIKEQRELDAWIAEHVFGFEIAYGEIVTIVPDPANGEPMIVDHVPPKNYSTDPAAAIEVLKKCVQRGKTINGKHGEHNVILWQDCGEGEFWCGMDFEMVDTESMSQSAPTLELAICLFARKLFEKGAS